MTPDPAAVRALRGFIFDMDGVIYRGDERIPGAAEFLAALRRVHVPFLFLTNNSTTPPPAVAARLATMGIAAAAGDIMTSAEATAAALALERPRCRVLVIGETGIYEALVAAGFVITDSFREADAVVVGLDRQATYARLREAALAIQRGALFLATNTDVSLPTPDGFVPGAGSLVAMLETATGQRARSVGKPAPDVFRMALARLGTPGAVTAAIGDRPETDILGGQLAGLKTIGVLTGAGTAAQFAALQPPPDWVFTDLHALAQVYFET